MGACVTWPISVDGHPAGLIAEKSYLYLLISPGNHSVRFGDHGSSLFTAEAGKNYCFIVYPFGGVKPIAETDARTFAETYTLSGLSGAEWAARFPDVQSGQNSYIDSHGVLVTPAMPINANVNIPKPENTP
jgi:hypothetical protein